MQETNNQVQQEKQSLFSFELNIPMIITMLVAIYFAYNAHLANMTNSQKMNQLLVKYEKTLDAAIAGDASSLKNYRKNVETVLAELSPQEKAILETALSLSATKAN